MSDFYPKLWKIKNDNISNEILHMKYNSSFKSKKFQKPLFENGPFEGEIDPNGIIWKFLFFF